MKKMLSGALVALFLLANPFVAAPAPAQTSPPAAPRKPQADVALKGKSFAKISPTDDSVKKALAAGDLAGAKKLVGKNGAFVGTVAKVFAPSSHSVVILNFAEKYKDALTAAVMGPNFGKFPDLTKLSDKKVLVSGQFSEYKGQMQILLMSPDQIKIVE